LLVQWEQGERPSLAEERERGGKRPGHRTWIKPTRVAIPSIREAPTLQSRQAEKRARKPMKDGKREGHSLDPFQKGEQKNGSQKRALALAESDDVTGMSAFFCRPAGAGSRKAGPVGH